MATLVLQDRPWSPNLCLQLVLSKPFLPSRASPFLLDGDQKKGSFSLLACSGCHVASSTAPWLCLCSHTDVIHPDGLGLYFVKAGEFLVFGALDSSGHISDSAPACGVPPTGKPKKKKK